MAEKKQKYLENRELSWLKFNERGNDRSLLIRAENRYSGCTESV